MLSVCRNFLGGNIAYYVILEMTFLKSSNPVVSEHSIVYNCWWGFNSDGFTNVIRHKSKWGKISELFQYERKF